MKLSSASTLLFASFVQSTSALTVNSSSQLAQLAAMTTLSIDSGDLNVISDYAETGLITDATTNPLFVSQAGLSGDPVYASMVDEAVQFAVGQCEDQVDAVPLAIDALAVNLGEAISKIVPGYISTEVDPRLSFDTEASVERARRIIQMYAAKGVSKDRVLIKLAATWEGIMAAKILEEEGITCNLTLIFSHIQAVACAQYGARLISPFPGRILDWYKKTLDRSEPVNPEDDEGVVAVKKMYCYYKTWGHENTICMPASWRPSRGSGYELDEIRELAGVDRMTIPAPLLEKLASCEEPLPQKLNVEDAKKSGEPLIGNGRIGEKEFRYLMNMDGAGNDKVAEGIRAFIGETEKLELAITEKVQAFVKIS